MAYDKFSYVGVIGKKVNVKDIDSKKSEWKGKDVSFSIAGGNTSQFIHLFGGNFPNQKKVKIMQMKEDGKSVSEEFEYEKRFEDVIVKNCPDFAKVKILDKEFVQDIDAINYIVEIFDEKLAGKKVYVTGDIEHDQKYGSKRAIKKLEIVKEDTKEQFKETKTAFFTSEAVDVDYYKNGNLNIDLCKEDKSIPISVYFQDTDRDKNVFYVSDIIKLNVSKVDFDNEKHVKRVKFLLDAFKCEEGKVMELGVILRAFRGAEKEEISIDDLTQFQKDQIELDILTLDDIKKASGSIYGENKEELQLVMINPKFKEGAIESDVEIEDLSYDMNDSEVEDLDNPNNVEDELFTDDDDLF